MVARCKHSLNLSVIFPGIICLIIVHRDDLSIPLTCLPSAPHPVLCSKPKYLGVDKLRDVIVLAPFEMFALIYEWIQEFAAANKQTIILQRCKVGQEHSLGID